jgi:tetraacyldisaccharide 4'-kinase
MRDRSTLRVESSAPGVAGPLTVGAAARRPVVSVGNLAMGGRGKTPTVACVSRLLVGAGERPAILSRGYGRRLPDDGVVIVSDGERLRADLDRSGDEPLMLARQVRGAAVLVCDVRAMAAALAETALDVTVHVLDDGFQHRSLRRDIDLVLVTPGDLDDRRLPFGRLRSPVSALAHADAVIVDGAEVADVAARLDRYLDRTRTRIFTLRRRLEAPRWIDVHDAVRPLPSRAEPVVAVAGIAQPERFQRALEADGWTVAALIGWPDHHQYQARDLARIVGVAAGRSVVTTEKDAVRLMPLRPLPLPIACVPLVAGVEPEDEFRTWLLDRLAGARA